MSLSHGIRTWLLAGTSMVGLAAAATVPASAMQIDTGTDISLTIDTTLSAGASFRTEDPSCQWIAVANGGCAHYRGYTTGITGDNMNLNYDGWDPISTTVKFTSDIEAKWENFGVFVRATGFYDYWTAEEVGVNTFGSSVTGLVSGGRRPLFGQARDLAAEQIEIRDYFVYGSFDIGEIGANIRVGNQVVNWGESLVIAGGINSYLPVDLRALRTPGAELKEGLLPQPTIYGSFSLPGNISLEAMYVYDYSRTFLDSCSTFFATDDTYFEGCRGASLTTDFPSEPNAGDVGYLDRVADYSPDHHGQWGMALKYYADWLNDGTELGLYYTNQHVKLPYGTFTAGDPSVIFGSVSTFCDLASDGAVNGLIDPDFNPGTVNSIANTFLNCNGVNVAPGVSIFQAGFVTYASTVNTVRMFAEDVETFGASFSTTVLGTAVAGEVSYTPEMPFQRSTTDIVASQIVASGTLTFFCADATVAFLLGTEFANVCGPSAIPVSGTTSGAVGSILTPWSYYDALSAQFNTTTLFNQADWPAEFLGASQVAIVTNFGMQYISDLPADSRLNISELGNEEHANFLSDLLLGDTISSCSPIGVGPKAVGTCNRLYHYADDFSWGYRLIMQANYLNAFSSGINLTPSIQFAHDVSGYSAGPIGPGFIEGRKGITLGLAADYLNQYRASIQWTSSFDGVANNREDKDFMSIDFSYSF